MTTLAIIYNFLHLLRMLSANDFRFPHILVCFGEFASFDCLEDMSLNKENDIEIGLNKQVQK